ncbi:MAG: FG-GAP repeat protein [Planctomycetota bacterium]
MTSPTVALCLLALLVDVEGADPAPHLSLAHPDRESVRAAYDDARHAVFARGDGGFAARSPRHRYHARFGARDVVIEPDGSSLALVLELDAWGRADARIDTDVPIAVGAVGRRFERRWDDALTEWFVNTDDGLEHGFDVAVRPPGEGALRFELACSGADDAVLSSDGRSVLFESADGELSLRYGGLVVRDARASDLAARFTTTSFGVAIEVDDAGATYPLTVDPIVQQAYLKASNTDADDDFGGAVAMDGDTIVVGAPNEDSAATGVDGDQTDDSAEDSGAVYVFVRDGSTWSQQAYLKASNTDAGDGFGRAVAVSGDTIVVGTNAEDSNATGVDGDGSNNSASFSGAAYVFVRNGATWSQQAYLKASNTGSLDFFGQSVAIDGDTIVVGSILGTARRPASAATRRRDRLGRRLRLREERDDVDAAGLPQVVRHGHRRELRTLVAVSGDTVAVGSVAESGVVSSSGAAHVFVRSGTTWSHEARLLAANADAFDFFGVSIGLSGDTVVVGAPNEDSAATGVDGDGTSDSHRAPARPTSSFGTARRGANRPISRRSTPARSTSTGRRSRSSATSSSSARRRRTATRPASTATSRTTRPSVPVRRTSTNARGRRGAGAPTSRPPTRARRTSSVRRWPSRATAWSSPRGRRTAARPASTARGGQQRRERRCRLRLRPRPMEERCPGCHGNTAHFVEPTGAAHIGTTTPVELLGSIVSDGVVATYYGPRGVDRWVAARSSRRPKGSCSRSCRSPSSTACPS